MFELEDSYWWFVARRRLALSLLKPLVGQGTKVVDLGCGTGAVLAEIAAWASPIGADMSRLALKLALSRGDFDLVQADGVALPLSSESVDAVIGLDVFEHIEDDAAALAECARVLRPGGVLVLSVPAFRSLWGPHDVALHHFRRYRKRQVAERLRAAGLEPMKLSYSVFFLFPLVVVTRIIEKIRPGPARASLPKVPRWLNGFLIKLGDGEAGLIRSASLPWGSSVVAVARKPAS
jgi:ubiquinone/menaquinone biosynthesis C-methylase UbiE